MQTTDRIGLNKREEIDIMLVLRAFLAKFYEPLIALLIGLIALLLFFLSTSLIATSMYKAEASKWKSDYKTLIEQNKTAILQAEVNKMTKEREWAEQLKQATEVYHEKIKILELDNKYALDNANRLSEQLDEANKRLATASRAPILNYTDTASDVLRNCVQEYRGMAELAQKHALDAQRLRASCPTS